jgi:hypothetical protein
MILPAGLLSAMRMRRPLQGRPDVHVIGDRSFR